MLLDRLLFGSGFGTSERYYRGWGVGYHGVGKVVPFYSPEICGRRGSYMKVFVCDALNKKISTLHQHLLEYVMKDVPHTILHIHPNNSIKAVINCSKATQLFTNTTFCFVWSFNRTLEQHSTDNPDINVPGNK